LELICADRPRYVDVSQTIHRYAAALISVTAAELAGPLRAATSTHSREMSCVRCVPYSSIFRFLTPISAFSGWFDIGLLEQRGVDMVVRKHQLQQSV
jgi:hypothetical protein